ncbi:MAG: hypothetical protein SOW25_08330 [Helicobacter sp.]|nr:hypothetical protein [Helicobacteraceae bacterium]MDY3114311.1 hypothetical protein [Helicobacter sp.]
MQNQAINLNETLSPTFLAYLKQQIANFKANPSDETIIDTIRVLTSELNKDHTLKTKEIKQEIEENLKGELATKDFVKAETNQIRAEINQVKADLIKWVVGVGVASVSANFALIAFLLENFK